MIKAIFVHGWILFIAVTIANGLYLRVRSKEYIRQNPALQAGYDKYFRGWLIYGNIPWVIIGIGNLSGMTSNIFDYFNPKTLNPMVLLFHASIIVLWILAVYWIYFKNGAEFIEKHPGLIVKQYPSSDRNPSVSSIKILSPLILFGGVVTMVMMWVIDFPTPKF